MRHRQHHLQPHGQPCRAHGESDGGYCCRDGREAFRLLGDEDAQVLVVEPVYHQDICIGTILVLAGEEGPYPVSMEEEALIRYTARLLHRLL